MKEKIKKVSILFLSMIVCITSLASTPFAISTVHATDIGASIEISSGVIDASVLVWDLIESTIHATGRSDILENEDTFNELTEIVADVLMNAGGGNFMESPAYEAMKKQYPEFAAMVGTGTIWNPAPDVSENDDVIEWDNWRKDPLAGENDSKLWDPTGKTWEPAPDLTDWRDKPWQMPYDKDNTDIGIEQREELGFQEGEIFKTGEDFLKEVYRRRQKMNGGGGSGGGDSGDSGNNSSKGTKVKIGTGILASVTALVVSLTSGKSGNEKIDSLMGTSETPSYTGSYSYDTVTKKYVYKGYADYNSSKDLAYLSYYFLEDTYGEKIAGVLRKDYSGSPAYWYNTVSFIELGNNNGVLFPKLCVRRKVYKSNGNLYDSTARYETSITAIESIPSVNFPVFSTQEEAIAFLKGETDDSTAINKEPKKLVWADVKSMAGKLPSTFNSLTNLPIGKALSSNALKDFNKDMTNYRKTASPDDLTNTDTLTKVATETMQKEVEKNTVDEKEKEDEDTKPAPMPEYPTPDKVDIDGSEATRDWRLVFPFCIPFDMIDLYRVFVAEPQAPHWEIPLKSETFNIDYTFVIDFEQFEVLAEIFRTFQIILFILGLCMITSKVIKW